MPLDNKLLSTLQERVKTRDLKMIKKTLSKLTRGELLFYATDIKPIALSNVWNGKPRILKLTNVSVDNSII